MSDLHLGKRLKGYSLIEDQRYILKQILDIADEQHADGVMIAGDVYDKNVPPSEAVELFDDFITALKKMNLPVFIISGNHDSAERLSFGARIMEEEKIYFSGVFDGKMKKVTLNDEFGEVNIYLLPFVKPVNVRQFFEEENIESYDDAVKTIISHTDIDESRRNIIVAHQYVTGASLCESEELNVGTLDNISASNFDAFDYAALGHIHGPQNIIENKVRYCGTPLKYSFSEVNHKKSVTLVTLGAKGDVSVELCPLEPLHDLVEIKGKYNDITARDFYDGINTEDYIHFTLTDEQDIPYVLDKLGVIYPNIMALDYDNTRTRTMSEITETEQVENKSPFELFGQLYKIQNGKEMDDIQQKYVSDLIEQIWGDYK